METRATNVYLINKFLLEEGLENYTNLVALANKAGIKPRVLQEARRGFPLNEEYCVKLCAELQIPFEEMCKEKPRKKMYGSHHEEYLQEGEKMMIGLKNRILSQAKGKDLEKMLDELIVEASYLGVNAHKNGNAEFIETAARKRRGQLEERK